MTTSAVNVRVDRHIERLLRREVLDETSIKDLCEALQEILVDEPNVARIESPVTVVGDLHGQFYDLLEMFHVAGKVPDTNFIFAGNMVDRGYFSVETLSLLLCLKLRFPSRVTLLRGNHETRSLSRVYGLYNECMRKYGNAKVWTYFTDLFDYLQVAALVDGKGFVVHGGLSPKALAIDQVRVLDRFREVPHEGALTDLLWSDPDPSPNAKGFAPNPRGAGCTFSMQATEQFMRVNDLEMVIRGNQLAMDGYQVLWGNKLATVWSAPNFAFRCNNVAAVLEISDNFGVTHFNTFTACPDSMREKPRYNVLKDTPEFF